MEFLYETHMHTSPVSACAESSPARQVRAYKDRGYTGIIVTDHFVNGNSSCPYHLTWQKKMEYFVSGYVKAKKEGDRCGLDVFFGWEFSIGGSDFLTYGLSPDFLLAHPDMDMLGIEKYSALVRGNGGFISQAHPYRKAFWIKRQHPTEPHLLDAIEVYNASMPADVNDKAYGFAVMHDLPIQAGSDSHSAHLHFSSGVILDKKAANVFDIIEAIKTRSARLITPDNKSK